MIPAGRALENIIMPFLKGCNALLCVNCCTIVCAPMAVESGDGVWDFHSKLKIIIADIRYHLQLDEKIKELDTVSENVTAAAAAAGEPYVSTFFSPTFPNPSFFFRRVCGCLHSLRFIIPTLISLLVFHYLEANIATGWVCRFPPPPSGNVNFFEYRKEIKIKSGIIQ